MPPSRHALGALLIDEVQLHEVEQIYRKDLGLAAELSRACIRPNQFRSLKRLYDCAHARDKTVKDIRIKFSLNLARAREKHPVKASCTCAMSKQG